MKRIEFTKGNWEDKLFHAISYRFEDMPNLVQKEDYVVNSVNKSQRGIMGYDYITVMTKEKYGVGTKVSSEVIFEGDAAPLITLSKELIEDEEGKLHFGNYYEVVLYKGGMNVWKMYMEEEKVKWHAMLMHSFPVEENKKHVFSVEIMENGLKIEHGEHKSFLHIEYMPKDMHVGITACEGITKIYSFTIED